MQPHQNLHWLCYILHSVSHWPVLEYFFSLYWCQPGRVGSDTCLCNLQIHGMLPMSRGKWRCLYYAT
jgi:hypothetical protein